MDDLHLPTCQLYAREKLYTVQGLLLKAQTDEFDRWDLYLQFTPSTRLKFEELVVVDFL